MASAHRERIHDAGLAALLVLVKLAAMLLASGAGFTHVSDDDYSRTVIAEAFAHAPKLDPSGTSWLPLPFWLAGGSMMVFGRSLGVARATAWCLGALGVVPPFLTLRHLGFPRPASWVAAAFAAVVPWSVWLAAATVPEGWAASLTASGLLLLASDRPRAAIASALLLLSAALCRYEAWPACAFAAGVFVYRAVREADRGSFLVGAFLAVLGPSLWMAWNKHAHGDPFHFFARVSAFRQASGAAHRSIVERVIEFPEALVMQFPEAVAGGVVALVGLRRTRVALLGALGVLVFLVVGDLKDGAPTHHPERALGAVAIVATTLGVVCLAERAPAWIARVRVRWPLFVVALGSWCALAGVRYFDPPGEDRFAQIAKGLELRRGERTVIVTPCEYEHFALIAALGAPERVTVEPVTHSPVTDACPRLRDR